MEWQSPKSTQVRGSYESSIKIRSQGGDGQGRATELFIDGNPSNYWNKSSRKTRWLGKSYLKGEDITSTKKGHRLPDELKNVGLENYADALIRIEFEIYKQEFLDRKIPLIYGHQFTESVIDELYTEYWGRIEMSAQASIQVKN